MSDDQILLKYGPQKSKERKKYRPVHQFSPILIPIYFLFTPLEIIRELPRNKKVVLKYEYPKRSKWIPPKKVFDLGVISTSERILPKTEQKKTLVDHKTTVPSSIQRRPLKYYIPRQQTPKLKGYNKLFLGKHNRILQTYNCHAVPLTKRREKLSKAAVNRCHQKWKETSPIENFLFHKQQIIRGNNKPIPKKVYNESKETFINFGFFILCSIITAFIDRFCTVLFAWCFSILKVEVNFEFSAHRTSFKTDITGGYNNSTVESYHELNIWNLNYYIYQFWILLLLMVVWFINMGILSTDKKRKRAAQTMLIRLPAEEITNVNSERITVQKVGIRMQCNGKTCNMFINQSISVKTLKAKIAKKMHLNHKLFNIYHKSKQLQLGYDLQDYGIEMGDIIHIHMKLNGGGQEKLQQKQKQSSNNNASKNADKYCNINLTNPCSGVPASSSSSSYFQPCISKPTKNKDKETKISDKSGRDVSKNWKNRMALTKSIPFSTTDKTTPKDHQKMEKSLNASTLSLHIVAYENSVEAKTVETDFLTESVDRSMKNVKRSATEICGNVLWENCFEFARQQSDNNHEPEIMQFKANQKLLNPNEFSEGNSSASVSHTVHISSQVQDETPIINVDSQPLEQFSQDLVDALDEQNEESGEQISRKRRNIEVSENTVKRVKSIEYLVDENEDEGENMEDETTKGFSGNTLSASNSSLSSLPSSSSHFKKESDRINFIKLEPFLTKYGVREDIQQQLGPKISRFPRYLMDQIVAGISQEEHCIIPQNALSNEAQRLFFLIVKAFYNELNCHVEADETPICNNNSCIHPLHYNIRGATKRGGYRHENDDINFIKLQPILIQHGVREDIQQLLGPKISRFPRYLIDKLVTGMAQELNCISPETPLSKRAKSQFCSIVKAFHNQEGREVKVDTDNPFCQDENCIQPFHYSVQNCNQERDFVHIPTSLHTPTETLNTSLICIDDSNIDLESSIPPTAAQDIATDIIEEENADENISEEEIERKIDKIIQFIKKDTGTPRVMVDNDQIFAEILKGIATSGEFNQERKIFSNLKKNLEIAQEYAIQNIPYNPSMYSSKQAFVKTVDFIAQLQPLIEMSCYVNRYRKLQNLPEYSNEEMSDILMKWKNHIFNMASSILGPNGYKSDRTGWAMGLRDSSRMDATKHGLSYTCYCISQEVEVDQFSDPLFHIQKVEEYCDFLNDKNSRVSAHLMAIIYFVHGRNKVNQEASYNENEFMALKSKSIVGSFAKIGVFLKLLGVFELDKSSFCLSSDKNLRKFSTKYSQHKVSSTSTTYPIMLPDVLCYFEQVPCDTVMALQARVLFLLGLLSGWRIGTILGVPLSPYKHSPGIRLEDLSGCSISSVPSVFPSANLFEGFKKSNILHGGSLIGYKNDVTLIFLISRIFMEFWGIFVVRSGIYEVIVERALVKI